MRRPLGKGLDALFPSRPAAVASAAPAATPAGGRTMLPLSEIVPNPDQPRRHFDEAALETLTDSIRQHGLLQPLVVRQTDAGYELIAGERRMRAATRAGLERVPVVFHSATDPRQRLALALIENLQREDLSPLEEAEAYRRLVDEHGLTQDEIAREVGKSRPAVGNALRLLNLPDAVKELLAGGQLTAGHARAVLAVQGTDAQVRFARELVAGKVTKAAAEEMVSARKPPSKRRKATAPLTVDVHLRALAEDLTRALGTRVRIARKAKGGAIEIEFYSDAELDRLADQLRASGAVRSAAAAHREF